MYTQANLNTAVAKKVSGNYTAADFLTIANEAVREVLGEVDLRSTIKKSKLVPNLFDEIYQYTCFSDLKGNKIIDILPQVGRGRYDRIKLVTAEEFDRKKQDLRFDRYGDKISLNGTQWLGDNIVAIDRNAMVNKLLISIGIDDTETVIDRMDSVGTWEGYGDGTNLTKDTDDYVKDNASINWDINADGGTTAGIVNSSLTSFDISDYLTTGSLFVWAYIPSTANITNFIVRVGSSSSAYYSITVTTNNEGNSFETGWNLLRFDFVNKSTVGTPTNTACTYVAIYMTKDSSKVSETDYRFDNLVLKVGKNYYVRYYSKYGWQDSSGTWIQDATTTTDVLNADADEFDLIVTKTAQLVEESLRNYSQADRHAIYYEKSRVRYVLENPSQALPLIQEYYTI